MTTETSSLPTPGRERVVWYDIVRLVAMYILVCCHSADPFNYVPEGAAMVSDIKFWGALWGSMMRPCVPLFVMLTGALLLPQQGPVGPFYKKRISRVFWPFLIWSVIYCLFPLVIKLFGGGASAVRDFIPYADEDFLAQSLPQLLQYGCPYVVHLYAEWDLPLYSYILSMGRESEQECQKMVPYSLGRDLDPPLLQLLHRPLPLGILRLEPVRSPLLFRRLQWLSASRALSQR